MAKWFRENGLAVNPTKTKVVIFVVGDTKSP